MIVGVRFDVLGPLRVRGGENTVIVSGALRRNLLAMLLTRPNRPVAAEVLVDALWDGSLDEGMPRLHVQIHRLRGILDDPERLSHGPAGYCLRLEPDELDSARFIRLVEAAEERDTQNPARATELLREALGLWRGRPYDGADAPGVAGEIQRLAERKLVAAELLYGAELRCGRHAAVVEELADLVLQHPLRERLHALLMTALYQDGRRADALAAYRRARAVLIDELGLEPGPELRTLEQRILDGTPIEPGPRTAMPGTRRRVPTPLSRFFGRANEIRTVRALLDDSRLVTVVGPPGAGKTRLGTEVGAELYPRFRDGACFVDLTPVRDGASVPAAVASALGIAEWPGCPVTDTVVETLATAELLVILDNCEHLVPAAATMAGSLLSGCGDVRVLATSRIALGITGEQLFPLPPLDLEPAVALFTDRARLVRPTDSIDDRDHHVERICRRMDGLPLAIELAAAWGRALSPAQILHRLDTVLPMLTSTEDPASRQRTMDATVGWSYRLLAPAQQVLFDQLSVFVGGFDLTAAEAVTDREVLDDLTALVDHSLVLAEESGAGMRYRLLEPVRQYGVTALAERGDVHTLARHAEHYLALAQRGDTGLRHADDLTAHMLELLGEEGNLLAAMAWARDNDQETALRIATALAYFWERRGAVNDGRARLSELLDAGVGDTELRAVALARLGRLAWRQRDNDAARDHYAESLTIMRRLGDPLGIARGLRSLALTECAAGNTAAATDLCEQSLRLFADHGHDTGRGWAWTVLGLTKFAEGDWPGGKHCCEQALEANRNRRGTALETTARLGIAFAAANTADIATHREHLTAVLVGQHEALRGVDDPDWMWAAAGLAANEGRTRASLRLAGAARAVQDRGNYMSSTLTIFSDAALARARREVGARAADRFMAQGAAMTTDQLIAEALERHTDADRPLSAREREVADLVGEGLTNEQIATRLVLSRRTVESHVERIKHKLELTGRNEVMAWVIGGRLEAEQARRSGSLRIPTPPASEQA